MKLSSTQAASILGCYNAPKGLWKPRRITVAALVRMGYAIELRSGAIELTQTGVDYAEGKP